jgi:ATP-binding cassette subfamily B protein
VRTASRLLIFIPGREAEYLLKNDYFHHLMGKQPPFFRRIDPGDLMSRGSNDIQFIRVLVGYAGLQILNIGFALPLNLTMMFDLSASLTFGCVVPLLGAGWIMRYAVRRMMTRYKSAQEELAALSDEILESYNGIRVIHAYGAQAAFLARFDERNDRYIDTNLELAFLRAWLMPAITVVGNLAILTLLYWGGTMVVEGSLHFSAVAAFAVYVGNLVAAMYSLGWVVNVIQRGGISLQRVLDVLDDPPLLPPVTCELPDGDLGIEVTHLDFSYPGSDRGPVLQDVSFSVKPGSTLGIFGTTGSGKSTLLRLLTRLETPPPGTIAVGGVDIHEVDPRRLRARISMVPQTPYLFGRSIADNIAMGATDAGLTDEQVYTLARQACLVDDLEALPKGLDTMVGERGLTLSGGQRQRTALARAFARHSRILILDDTLSAVDQDTEQRLIRSIYEGASGRTTVLVSHRVSALQHADHILVFHAGRILQRGTHAELIAQGGMYANAWRDHELSQRDAEAHASE